METQPAQSNQACISITKSRFEPQWEPVAIHIGPSGGLGGRCLAVPGECPGIPGEGPGILGGEPGGGAERNGRADHYWPGDSTGMVASTIFPGGGSAEMVPATIFSHLAKSDKLRRPFFHHFLIKKMMKK